MIRLLCCWSFFWDAQIPLLGVFFKRHFFKALCRESVVHQCQNLFVLQFCNVLLAGIAKIIHVLHTFIHMSPPNVSKCRENKTYCINNHKYTVTHPKDPKLRKKQVTDHYCSRILSFFYPFWLWSSGVKRSHQTLHLGPPSTTIHEVTVEQKANLKCGCFCGKMRKMMFKIVETHAIYRLSQRVLLPTETRAIKFSPNECGKPW